MAGHESVTNRNTTSEHHRLCFIKEGGLIGYGVALVCLRVKKPVVDDRMWRFSETFWIGDHLFDMISKEYLEAC